MSGVSRANTIAHLFFFERWKKTSVLQVPSFELDQNLEDYSLAPDEEHCVCLPRASQIKEPCILSKSLGLCGDTNGESLSGRFPTRRVFLCICNRVWDETSCVLWRARSRLQLQVRVRIRCLGVFQAQLAAGACVKHTRRTCGGFNLYRGVGGHAVGLNKVVRRSVFQVIGLSNCFGKPRAKSSSIYRWPAGITQIKFNLGLIWSIFWGVRSTSLCLVSIGSISGSFAQPRGWATVDAQAVGGPLYLEKARRAVIHARCC